MARLRYSRADCRQKSSKTFLEGLPQRYLRTYAADEVLRHLEMAQSLGKNRCNWHWSAAVTGMS